MNPYMSEHYNMDDNGNFRDTDEYERAVENGDIDDNGYDDEGNQYDDNGDLI